MSSAQINHAFQIAVRRGDFDQMKITLENGADINHPFNQEYPAIHYAVATRDLPLLSFLIENGADVNTPKDATPLGKMFFYHGIETLTDTQIAIIEKLICSGADVTLKNPDRKTIWEHIPLHLKKQIFPIIQKTNPSQKVLSQLTDTALQEALSARSMDEITYWLQAGASVNVTGTYKTKALHYATLVRDVELTQFLLDKDADGNAQSAFYHTALHTLIIGAEKCNPENRYRLLNDNPYDVYYPIVYNVDGGNIQRLKEANQHVWEYTFQIARLLLERGANPYIRDNWGKTADDYVTNRDNKQKLLEIIETVQPIKPIENFPLLQWNPVQMTKKEALSRLFGDAYRHRDFEKMKIAIQNGYDINACDAYGTLLHNAVSRDDIEMATFLIENGADVSKQDGEGNTPLHRINWLCVGYPEEKKYPVYPNETKSQKLQRIIYEYKQDIGHHYWPKPHHMVLQEQPVELKSQHRDMVDLLVRAGADLNAQNNDGTAPLNYVPKKVLSAVFETVRACFSSPNESVETAIQNATNYALYSSMLFGKTNDIKYWVKAGANVDLPNDTGSHRPINYGANALDVELVTILAEKNADMTFQNEIGDTAWHGLCQGGQEIIGYMQELYRYLGGLERHCYNDAMQNDLYILRQQHITDEDMEDMMNMMCNRCCQIAQTLLKSGVNPIHLNNRGKTGLHYIENWRLADSLIKTINAVQPPRHITNGCLPARANETDGRPRS